MIKNQKILIYSITIILPIIAMLLSFSIGRYSIFENGFFYGIQTIIYKDIDELTFNVFWKIRFPRTIVAFFVGGVLGVSGCVLQSVFRNPLVSPDIIGIPSGASLGAAIAIIFFNGSLVFVQLFSFLGGLLAVFIIFTISSLSKSKNVTSIILTGMLVNSISNASITMMKYIADPTRQLPALEYWIMGSFERASIKNSLIVIIVGFVGTVFLFLIRWQINIISLGDDEAKSIGISVNKIRTLLILVITFMVTTSVSICGIIGWVGLISPHIVRMIFGNDHVKTIKITFFVGATIMIIADTLARSLATIEIPVSVITAFLGAPILGYLIWKVGVKSWD